MWLDPAFLPATIDDGAFDRLDGDRIVVDVQRAGRLARCGADAAGEFWKVIGRVKRPQRGLPLVTIDQVVPVRDQVVDRTAGVTEWDAAIHAARRLCGELWLRQRLEKFFPGLAAHL